MNRDEKKIIGLTTTSHSLVHLFEGVLPPLIPLVMLEFGANYFQMGIVVTVFSYAFGLGSLPAGFFSDRIGPRRLITLYLFGSGIMSLFVWFSGSLLAYGVMMGMIGMFCSTYHPASNALISHAIKEKGSGFGIHGIAGSLGIAGVPVVSAWVGSAMGWRAPHVLFGLVAIAVGFYSLTIPRQPDAQTAVHTGVKEKKTSEGIPYLSLVIFFLSATMLGLTYKGTMTFLPAYMGENVRLSFVQLDVVTLGGTMATIALLSGAVGQYLAGRLVDRYQAERLYLGAVLVGTICMFIMAGSINLILVLSSIVYAFFYFSTQPVQNYILSNYMPKHRQGLGFGIHFFLTFGVGSTAAAVSGYLADQFGLKTVFYFMGFCFILSAVLITFLLIKVNSAKKKM